MNEKRVKLASAFDPDARKPICMDHMDWEAEKTRVETSRNREGTSFYDVYMAGAAVLCSPVTIGQYLARQTKVVAGLLKESWNNEVGSWK